MKAIRLDTEHFPKGSVGHWCPGCQSGHEITVAPEASANLPRWTFNGDYERPSFTPSINIRVNPREHKHYQPDIASMCHYFIKRGGELRDRRVLVDGKPPDANKSYIDFLPDCTHKLKGTVVELPDLPANVYVTSQHLHARR